MDAVQLADAEPIVEPAPPRSPGRSRRVAWWLGILASASAVAVTTAVPYLDEPIVVAGVIPRVWPVVGALVLMTTGSFVASALLQWDNRARGTWHRLLRFAAIASSTVVALFLAGAAFLMALILDASTDYEVLSPSSPGGCRIVVGQNPHMFSGSGTVFVLAEGQRRPRETDRYTTDPGSSHPINAGTYELTWRGEVASLRVWGVSEALGDYESPPIDCRSARRP